MDERAKVVNDQSAPERGKESSGREITVTALRWTSQDGRKTVREVLRRTERNVAVVNWAARR